MNEIDTTSNDIETLIDTHFDEVRERVPGFYDQHFSSFTAILGRHWRNKKDIPRDLAHIPIKLYGFGKRVITRKPAETAPEPVSGKDAELMNLMIEDLLLISDLENKLQNYLAENTAEYDQYQQELDACLKQFNEEKVMQVINEHIQKINIPREGSREILVFLALGIAGKALSHKIAFGSSLGFGAAIASSIYVSQQSWLGALWIKFSGIPGWVTMTGATAGIMTAFILAPLITPFSELMVNRMRGEKFLYDLVDRYHLQINDNSTDKLNLAGHLACYAQALPELIQALRMLRL